MAEDQECGEGSLFLGQQCHAEVLSCRRKTTKIKVEKQIEIDKTLNRTINKTGTMMIKQRDRR